MKPLLKTISDLLVWVFKFIQGTGTFLLGLFLILIFVASINSFNPDPGPEVPNGAVLVVNPQGIVIEQKPVPKPFAEISPFGDNQVYESLHDVLAAINMAKDDGRISALAIYTNSFAGAGSAATHEIADAIRSFKESEKPVYAISNAYSQTSYLLAAEADTIYLNGQGSVLLSGYGIYPMYYKELFEKIEATIEVFRVGTYKSAVEPYTRDSMSEEVRVSNGELIGGLWQAYADRIGESRDGLTSTDVTASVDEVVARLRDAKGDFAQMAKDNGFVDEIGPRASWRKALIDVHGADSSGVTFKQINHNVYLQANAVPKLDKSEKPEIAVITAQGIIMPGSGPATVAASSTVVDYIRKARTNSNTKAIVLRVDSPGGSAFASEQIRQELVTAQQQGIPVIASMGSLAASGGYWISATADKIIAAPTTITGSIGIFAVVPTYQKTAEKIGVRVDGVATSELAAGFNPIKGLNDTVRQVLQLSIEDGYSDFLDLVADGRSMTREDVDAVAQGRVWLGSKALELGLVDQLGSFDDAIVAAAEAAEIDEYGITFYKEEIDPFDQFLIDALNDFGMANTPSVPDVGNLPGAAPKGTIGNRSVVQDMIAALRRVDQDLSISDPNGRMILCMVCRPDF